MEESGYEPGMKASRGKQSRAATLGEKERVFKSTKIDGGKRRILGVMGLKTTCKGRGGMRVRRREASCWRDLEEIKGGETVGCTKRQ